MSYPNYPNNRIIIVDGGKEVDLTIQYQLILSDGYTLNPPEPKTYTVDVPGGDGNIDLTESLMGDTAYGNRTQEFIMLVIDMDDEKTFEQRKTEVSNYLHGRAFDYRLTMDPSYTYHGRFSVSEYNHSAIGSGILGSFKISVKAQPYKTKGHMTFDLNATGGKWYRLPSGRKKVHPTLQCTKPCRIRFGDIKQVVPAGTFKLNDVLFEIGYNNIYINSFPLQTVTWNEVMTDGGLAMTWSKAKTLTWDDIQRLNVEGAQNPQRWADVAMNRWSDLATTKWSEIDFRTIETQNAKILLKYDWKDL